jgi:MarR family transcriptional regulator, lower aerobic nicotinate degradation pathway regulator
MAATETTPRHAAQSLALLSHLARVSEREAEAGMPCGLRTAHLMLLTLLRDHGAAAQSGLAEALRLDPSNLVGLLNDLERRGLIVRRRDPDDRRRHIVDLAPDGIAELRNTEQRLAAVEERVLSALTPDERGALHELLMRAAGGQLPPDACQ